MLDSSAIFLGLKQQNIFQKTKTSRTKKKNTILDSIDGASGERWF